MDRSDVPGTSQERKSDRLLGLPITLEPSTLVFVLLLVFTVLTRFYALGTRVMSHDETTHVYFSWLYQQGRGYVHDPLSHGPLQFHLLALSYAIFGDSDTSARVPAAVSGVLAICILWAFRRWLGRTTALVTAALLFASPFMLYYSRYARNESFVVTEALLMFFAVLAYFETRQSRYLYLLSASLALHYCTKETSFIYGAFLLIFLGALLALDLLRRKWSSTGHFVLFIAGLASAVIGAGAAMAVFLSARASAGETATIAVSPVFTLAGLLGIGGLILLVAAMVLDFGPRLRSEFPALDLLVIAATVTLPQLAALPAQALGWDPQAYGDPAQLARTLIVVLILGLAALGIGLAWDWKRWGIAAAIFFAIFIPLYTSLFSNPRDGMLSGLIGSLGYWLVQHGVERGSQPLYYYLLIQIPIYEYLPAVGALLAAGIGLSRLWARPAAGDKPDIQATVDEGLRPDPRMIYPILFGTWAIFSLVAFTYAGERMPWITVHIALPLILLAGWALGPFLKTVPWSRFRQAAPWFLALLTGLAIVSFARALGYLLGDPPPFQGVQLEQLRATTGFLTGLAVCLVSLAVCIVYGFHQLSTGWSASEMARLAGVMVISGLYLLTLRASLRASFVNYDDATEFLVYAHSASGPKLALSQLEELSRRTTGGLDIDVGYDNLSTYPFWWYLRNYRNAHFFGDTPSRDLLNYPAVLAGQANWTAVEAVLRNRYYVYEYMRMWWPMQEYYGLTWERVRNALVTPAWRKAVWDIWLNRDYTAYGQALGRDFSLRNWDPAEKMRLYVRKDVGSMVWYYGVTPGAVQPVVIEDPYVSKMRVLEADLVFGQTGNGPGQFSHPRAVAVGPDDSLYVADTDNHRIQRFSPDGEVLATWGRLADIALGDAPGGTFNQPWGVAVAPDGTVYVADTWNHRVQHFSAAGEFLGMFGHAGQAEVADAFWGPRAVAVDEASRLYVADTGNKRVAVFDKDGQPVGEFGGGGALPGMLDEPVGVTVGPDGLVYVADTWNQRVQAFQLGTGGEFESVVEWPIDGWFGQSLDNKPYLDMGQEGRICLSDPEGYRVLCFSSTGEFIMGWGEIGTSSAQFGLPSGVAFDAACGVWVADSKNDRMMHFSPGLCP